MQLRTENMFYYIFIDYTLFIFVFFLLLQVKLLNLYGSFLFSKHCIIYSSQLFAASVPY